MDNLINLLMDIEAELHFHNPHSSKLTLIRRLVQELKEDNIKAKEKVLATLPSFEAELCFSGVSQNAPIIKRIRGLQS